MTQLGALRRNASEVSFEVVGAEARQQEQVVITLSQQEYRLLQQAFSAAQLHPGCSEAARKQFADLGWAIHCQTQY